MILDVSEIPPNVLRPDDWTVWKAVAYAGKSGDVKLGETFVRAGSEQSAIALGKSALRMTGIGGRFVVNAARYYPWLDPAFRGFIGYRK